MILNTLDAHSALVTASATVVLALVTVLYVRATYQLVAHQRLQLEVPDVACWFVGNDQPDLRFKNVGKGTAAQVTVLAGPGEGVSAEIPLLGTRYVLLPGEETIWEIRPDAGHAGFSAGDLPLTLLYLDSSMNTLHYKVVVLRFTGDRNNWQVRNLGYSPGSLDCLSLKRLTRKNTSNPLRRLKHRWQMRGADLPRLIIDESARLAMRKLLLRRMESLLAADPKMQAVRTAV